jgi:hypothetical protein
MLQHHSAVGVLAVRRVCSGRCRQKQCVRPENSAASWPRRVARADPDPPFLQKRLQAAVRHLPAGWQGDNRICVHIRHRLSLPCWNRQGWPSALLGEACCPARSAGRIRAGHRATGPHQIFFSFGCESLELDRCPWQRTKLCKCFGRHNLAESCMTAAGARDVAQSSNFHLKEMRWKAGRRTAEDASPSPRSLPNLPLAAEGRGTMAEEDTQFRRSRLARGGGASWGAGGRKCETGGERGGW